MFDPVRTQPGTSYQRAEIIRLLQELEFDHVRLTLMHRRVGAPEHMIQSGDLVDHWLDKLTVGEASELIKKMQGML